MIDLLARWWRGSAKCRLLVKTYYKLLIPCAPPCQTLKHCQVMDTFVATVLPKLKKNCLTNHGRMQGTQVPQVFIKALCLWTPMHQRLTLTLTLGSSESGLTQQTPNVKIEESREEWAWKLCAVITERGRQLSIYLAAQVNQACLAECWARGLLSCIEIPRPCQRESFISPQGFPWVWD